MTDEYSNSQESHPDKTATQLTILQKIVCVLALISLPISAYAQRSSELSADFPDSRTMAVQDKVERLFDAAQFERAFFIYRNELSPIGDKYAQYMVGFMYHEGMGVEEDPVSAAAWYQLAAERGTREFVVVRDRLLHVMDEDDAVEARVLYQELRLRYCDMAVLLASIKRNVRELRNRTGSRVGGQTSPLTVIDNRSSGFNSSTDFYSGVREQLEARVRLLKEIGDFQDLETDADRINIRDLESRVLQQIRSESS